MERGDPPWMTWAVRIIGAAMLAFTAWFVWVILFDPGTGPCLSLGGC